MFDLSLSGSPSGGGRNAPLAPTAFSAAAGDGGGASHGAGRQDGAPLLAVSKLSKRYGITRAVENVSFQVRRGEIRGFLGPNGAGKSTTIRMITGYLSPDAGSVHVAGIDVGENALEARKKIGYLPESLPLYWEMRVDEYLRFIAQSRSMPAPRARARIDEVIQALGLERMRKRLTGSLSKGYRQRVGLAQALLHDPDILILDEPTNGLDPHQIIEIRALLARLAAGKAILFSTHILQEISAICSKIMIISDGQLIAEGSPDELAALLGATRVWEVVVTGDAPLNAQQVAQLDLGELLRHTPHAKGTSFTFSADAGTPDLARLAAKFSTLGRTLLEAHQEERSLEQIYLSLTARSAKGAA